MTFSTTNVYPLSLLASNSQNVAIVVFCLEHIVLVIIEVHCAKTFYTTWVRRVPDQKQLLGQKLMGV